MEKYVVKSVGTLCLEVVSLYVCVYFLLKIALSTATDLELPISQGFAPRFQRILLFCMHKITTI